MKGRLTTPLVRDGDALRPASWDEALDTVAAGFANSATLTKKLVREGDQRDELPGAEVRAPGDALEQHRLV